MSEREPLDAIMSIAMPLAVKAVKGDSEAGGKIIEALATTLARVIVRVARGDPAKIEELLTGCESYMASEATSMVNTLNTLIQGNRPNG